MIINNISRPCLDSNHLPQPLKTVLQDKWCLSLLDNTRYCLCAVYCSAKYFYGWPPRENALLILLSLTSTIQNRICMSLLCAAPQATSELQHFLLRLSLVLPHFIQKFLIDLTTYLNKRPNTNQLLKMKLQARQFFCLPSITI